MAIDYSVFNGLSCALPKGPSRLDQKAEKDKQADKAADAFRAAVWKRDGGKCRKCGATVAKTLELMPKQGHVHHLAKRSKVKALLTDVRNGILLCATDHQEVEHKRLFIVTSGKGSLFELDGQWFIDAGHKGVRFVSERPEPKGKAS